jgi:hypothetical protein
MRRGVWTLDFELWTSKDRPPLPGRPGGIIDGANKSFFIRQQFHDFFMVHRWSPQVIASTPAAKISAAGLGSDARPASRILTIGDDKIEGVTLPELRQQTISPRYARFADNIANKEKFHHGG